MGIINTVNVGGYDVKGKVHSLKCQIGAAKGWIRIYKEQGLLYKVVEYQHKLIDLEAELAAII